MDERENLLRVVRFEGPEYIPVTFHINDACWHHYPSDALQDLMEGHPFLFPDFQRSPDPIEPDYPPYARAGEPFVDPWGCVWETADSGLMGVVTAHALQSWDDFENYCPPDSNETTHWGPVDWEAEAENIGPAISQTSLPNGEIGHNHTWLKLIDIRGYQNVIFDMADRESRLFRLAEDLGMQHGPMLSPKNFREYIQPSYRRLMNMAHDAGCIVHVHADGDIRALIGDLLDCGVDVINLQDLVNGIDWMAEHLAGRICMDLDIDRQNITPHGTPAQVDALIREEVEKLGSKQGGLMMIYGLYPGVPLENVRALMDAMEKYATYYA
jgi:hypothetical protein